MFSSVDKQDVETPPPEPDDEAGTGYRTYLSVQRQKSGLTIFRFQEVCAKKLALAKLCC
jgi:hypothetical protein